jgi:hypothetical protein
MRRLFPPWSCALALALSWAAAAAAWAGEIRTAPLVAIPPLVLGTASQASNPLWAAMASKTQALQGLSGVQAAALLTQSAASAHPLEALSSWAIARAATEPKAAQVLLEKQPELAPTLAALKGSESLAALADAGKADAALNHFFDGTEPSLGFEDVRSVGRWLRHGKQKLQWLGAGEFGAVYAHPKAEGAVIKAVEHGFEIAVFQPDLTLTQTADEEETMSRLLADADAGPRYLGRTVHARRELSARERIYGKTMQSLSRDREFGEEERKLVLDLLRRMAKARLITDDKRPPNIMIGHTLLDRRRRAYLVDGGHALAVDPSWTEDQIYEALLHQLTIVVRKFDHHMGPIEISKPFSMMLDEAVHRARPLSRWGRFWDSLKEAVLNPVGGQ